MRNTHVKVHVRVGISAKGATDICIFNGIMDADFYCQNLERFLIPFIQEQFPRHVPRFMQDNDPKHTSRLAQNLFQANNINWWRVPGSKPHRNLWHELKEHLRAKVKPCNQAELIEIFLGDS